MKENQRKNTRSSRWESESWEKIALRKLHFTFAMCVCVCYIYLWLFYFYKKNRLLHITDFKFFGSLVRQFISQLADWCKCNSCIFLDEWVFNRSITIGYQIRYRFPANFNNPIFQNKNFSLFLSLSLSLSEISLPEFICRSTKTVVMCFPF